VICIFSNWFTGLLCYIDNNDLHKTPGSVEPLLAVINHRLQVIQ